MKQYKKTYEDVFSSDRATRKCNIDLVSTDHDDLEVDKYTILFRNEMNTLQRSSFKHLVKIVWLARRFKYNDKKYDVGKRTNGQGIAAAFGVFTRRYVGIDFRIVSQDSVLSVIMTYLDTLFPDFDTNSPFDNEYEYPFEHVWFEHMILVHQMDERMELLKHAEVNRMTYIDFSDYIINYVLSFNDENGEKYKVILKNIYNIYTYVKKNKKYEEPTNINKTKAGNVRGGNV